VHRRTLHRCGHQQVEHIERREGLRRWHAGPQHSAERLPLSCLQELPRGRMHVRGASRMQLFESSGRDNKGMLVWCERCQRVPSRCAIERNILCDVHVPSWCDCSGRCAPRLCLGHHAVIWRRKGQSVLEKPYMAVTQWPQAPLPHHMRVVEFDLLFL